MNPVKPFYGYENGRKTTTHPPPPTRCRFNGGGGDHAPTNNTANGTTNKTTTMVHDDPTKPGSPSSSSSSWATFKQDAIVIILCLFCYHNALWCDFVFDDISAIKENKDLRPETPIVSLFRNDFWGLPMDNEKSHKSYRPLCVWTFRLNYLLHQLRPFGYHLTNVLLHIIVSLQYLRFCRLFMSTEASLIAAVIFSVHPIHTEAVTSVVGRAETLCALFYLCSLFAYVRAATSRSTFTKWCTFMVAIITIGMATFSKEQGITAVAICLMLELTFNQKLLLLQRLNSAKSSLFWTGKYQKILRGSSSSSYSSWSSAAAGSCPKWIKEMIIRILILVTFALFLLIERAKLMRWQLPIFTKFDNPASNANNPLTRQLTYNYLYALNAFLLLNPAILCCDWTMGSIKLVDTFLDPRNIPTLVFHSILAALIYKSFRAKCSHCRRIVLCSISLMIIPFIPASNIFFPVGFVLAERILYIPSFGFCMLISHGITIMYNYYNNNNAANCQLPNDFGRSQKKNTRIPVKYILSIAFWGLILIHSVRTILRNEDWRTEQSIFSAGIKVNENNAKLFNNLGHVYEANQQYPEALKLFLKAIDVQHDDIGAYGNVARIYQHLNRFDMAEKYYSLAKKILMDELEQHKPRRMARIAPGHLSLFLNLANLISKNHTRLQEADFLYRQVITMRSDYVEAYINRGDILLRMNRTTEADRNYRTALNYDGQNADIYYNLGVVAIHSNNLDQAIQYFDKAIHLNPEHWQALFNFALVVQDAKCLELFPTARRRLEKLSRFDRENERIYFNMGMISMTLKDFAEAEKWFKQALNLKPNWPHANFNLALLLAETRRPLEAIPYLKRLLQHHPGHLKGLTLLADILINYAKNFDEAMECYDQILKLDPNNIQAKHNQCVVYIEKKQLDQAEKCLEEAKHIAPNQNYIDRHLKIVKLRIIKLRQTISPDL